MSLFITVYESDYVEFTVNGELHKGIITNIFEKSFVLNGQIFLWEDVMYNHVIHFPLPHRGKNRLGKKRREKYHNAKQAYEEKVNQHHMAMLKRIAQAENRRCNGFAFDELNRFIKFKEVELALAYFATNPTPFLETIKNPIMDYSIIAPFKKGNKIRPHTWAYEKNKNKEKKPLHPDLDGLDGVYVQLKEGPFKSTAKACVRAYMCSLFTALMMENKEHTPSFIGKMVYEIYKFYKNWSYMKTYSPIWSDTLLVFRCECDHCSQCRSLLKTTIK